MKKIVFALLLCMLSLSAFCQSPVTSGGTPIEWQVKIGETVGLPSGKYILNYYTGDTLIKTSKLLK